MAPDLYRVIALEDNPVAIILRHLQDGVIRIGVSRVLGLEGLGLFQVVLLEDQLAVNRGKGSRGQAGLVVEVGIFGNRVVGILHPDRGRHLCRGDHHGLPDDLRLRAVPLPVFAAKPEVIQLGSRGGLGGFNELARFPAIPGHALAAHHQAAKEAFLLKGDLHLFSFHLVAAVNRSGAGNVLAVLLGKGPAGHAHPGMQFVVVVDASGIGRIEIGLHHHAHVFAIVGKVHVLHLADVGKADVIRIGCPVALHLGEIERHPGHPPGIPPSLDQGFHSRCIDPAIPAVAGPLAPDRTTDGIRNNGSNLAVEELGRSAPHAGDSREVRAAGHLAPGLRNPAGLLLPCLQVLAVFHESLAALLGERIRIVNKVAVFFQLGMILYRLALGKGLNPRVAVGTEQDSDGNVQLLIELVGKGKGEGRESTRGAGFLPALLRSGPLLRIKGGHGGNVDFPDGHVLRGRGNFLGQLIAHALARRPDHVGLPGGEPDLADQHPLERDRFPLVVPYLELPFLPGCLQGIEFHHPVTVLIRHGGLCLPGKLDADFVSRFIKTPDRNIGFPLQDHVVREGNRQFQLLIGGRHAENHQ